MLAVYSLSIAPFCQASTRNAAVYVLTVSSIGGCNLHHDKVLVDREGQERDQYSIWLQSVLDRTGTEMKRSSRSGGREVVKNLTGPINAQS